MKKAEAPAPKWCTREGSPIACTEKNKVMAENLEEIKGYIQMAFRKGYLQDAIDDAVLMECSEASFREAYLDLIRNLHSQYPEQKARAGEENDKVL